MRNSNIDELPYRLERRIKAFEDIRGDPGFSYYLIRFWNFLHKEPLLVGILEELEKLVDKEIESKTLQIVAMSGVHHGVTERENILIAYCVIKNCVTDGKMPSGVGNPYVDSFGFNKPPNRDGSENSPKDLKHALDAFRYAFLLPLYHYIDESLDSQRVMLGLLQHYKHKCEWFQRDHLRKLINRDTQRSEKSIQSHLFEYLHDRGIEFSIDPWSISGEPDFVTAQTGEDPLVAEVKIYNGKKRRILDGFNQVYLYSQKFNRPFGYLIIFNNSENELKFSLSNQSAITPFVTHNNKTIFIVTIGIFLHKTTASKRGRLRAVEIKEEELVKLLKKADLNLNLIRQRSGN